MTEYISQETRWFLKINEIGPIVTWFESLSNPQHLGDNDSYPRQDYYLNMPGVGNLGIKLREPKKDAVTGKMKALLEVKQMISEKELLELTNKHVKGYAAKWQKLSYEFIEGGNDFLSLNRQLSPSDNHWIRVDKDRMLAMYDAEKKSIAAGKAIPGEGCGIELTRIKVNGPVYYSFGLEAFSRSGKKLERNFTECCDFTFTQIRVLGLTPETSLSYPEFLAGII